MKLFMSSWIYLDVDEVALTLLRDLDESVAGHILDTIVRLVHELEKLVDDGF